METSNLNLDAMMSAPDFDSEQLGRGSGMSSVCGNGTKTQNYNRN